MATGPEVMQMLIARGLSPLHAAALAGHGIQESSLNPSAYNPKEDAYGVIQWRGSRLDALRQLAKERGVPQNDLVMQLDFILQEMAGPEAKAGSAFFAANDLPSAHAALKRYIRYGDNSDPVRLGHAQALLGGGAAGKTGTVPAAPFSLAAAADPETVQQAPAASNVAQMLTRGLADDKQEEPFEPMRIEMAKPVGLAGARRLLAAMKGS